MEAEIAKYGSEAVLKKLLGDRKPGPPCLPKDNPFGVSPDDKLPLWLSQDDLKYYYTKFDQKGFTGGLNYYRALDLYVTLIIILLLLECVCDTVTLNFWQELGADRSVDRGKSECTCEICGW